MAAGRLTAAEFKAIEDGAVSWAIQLQQSLGLRVITDGEFRRLSFQSPLVEAMEGFGEWDLDAFLWGHWHSNDEAIGELKLGRPAHLGVIEKLRRKRYLGVKEFVFLRALTARTPKITLPSPSLWVNF